MAGIGINEWIDNSYIINRQINYAKTLEKYHGYVLFRYDFLFNKNLINEKSFEEIGKLKNNN